MTACLLHLQHYAPTRGLSTEQGAVGSETRGADLDITFTATSSRNGDLLLGSSRDAAGGSAAFDGAADMGGAMCANAMLQLFL